VTTIRCKAVLFDMDGVLVDSSPAVARVWRWWAERHGFDPDTIVRRAHGRPNSETMRELLPHGDYVAETLEVERRELEDNSDVVALPGAAELLRVLPEDRWTIVTSATRELAKVRLRAAGLPVPKSLVTASDLTHGKPHPEPYEKGASVLGTPPSECLVVEDAPSGVRSGKAAGARVLAICTTMTGDELLAAGADWLADDLSSLLLREISPAHLTFSLHDPR
jgi:mannitol-1-/sugar-/sorbitol-6-phosphatase